MKRGASLSWLMLWALMGFALPVALYAALTYSPGAISAQGLRGLMQGSGPRPHIIDLRPAAEFQRSHIEGSLNVPMAGEATMQGIRAAVPGLQGSSDMVLVCALGMDAARAVRMLRAAGLHGARALSGGIDGWVTSGGFTLKEGGPPGLVGSSPQPMAVQYTLVEQWLLVLSGFAVKPFYTLVALLVFLALYQKKETDLFMLKWSMAAFFVGENFCALNFLLFDDTSALVEYVHGSGMAVSMALALYALMWAADKRVVGATEEARRCAMLPVCTRCYKHHEVPCTLRHVFMMLSFGSFVLALMPLCAPLVLHYQSAPVAGTERLFGHPMIYQSVELRVFPLVSAVMFLAALGVLWKRRERGFAAAKALFAAGSGLLGFGYFRWLLFYGLGEAMLWSDVWEEVTELLFIGFVAWVAYKVWRQGRGANRAEAQKP